MSHTRTSVRRFAPTVNWLEDRTTPTAYVATGPAVQVNVTHDEFSQQQVQIAADAQNKLTVVWADSGLDSNGFGVYARQLNPDLTPIAGQFRVNTVVYADQYHPAVATNASGQTVVVFRDTQDPFNYSSQSPFDAQRYDSVGNTQGTNQTAVTYSGTTGTTYYDVPAMVYVAPSGGYTVAPVEYSSDGTGATILQCRVARFEADGSPTGMTVTSLATSAADSNPYAWSFSVNPDAVRFGADGSVYVPWYRIRVRQVPDVGTQYDYESHVSHITPTGDAFGDVPLVVATFSSYPSFNYQPAVAPLPGGGFLTVYPDTTKALVARRFSADGTVAGGPAALVSAADFRGAAYYSVSATTLSDGNVVATWNQFQGSGLNFRVVTADGVPVSDVTHLGDIYYKSKPMTAADNVGGFFIAWGDPGGTHPGNDLYVSPVMAQHFEPHAAVTLTITPEALPDGTVEKNYSQSLTVAGGTGAYTFTVTTGSLPAGLSLSSDGVLSGTPTTATTGATFTVTVTNPVGDTGNRIYTLAVSEATVPPTVPQTYVAVGGAPGRVVVSEMDGSIVTDFRPYGNSYAGAVSVAWGDVNGDGHRDLVTGALTGNPHVLVFSGKAFADGTFSPANPYAALLASFFPYGLGFNVGSNVAAGDFDGDGFAEVVTGASPGNPHVEVYDGKTLPGTYTGGNPFGSLRTSFFAYGVGFNVGAYVAVGDVDGDGTPELVTGSSRGNPHVLVFRGTALADRTLTDANKYSNLLGSFYSYGLSFNVGAAVAVGDVDGDGKAEVITGSSVGSPHVKVYAGAAFAAGTFSGANPDASLVGSFFAYQPANGRGATVAAVDVNGDGKKEVLTGSTGVPRWRVVGGTSTGTLPAAVLDVTETVLLGGISVG